MRILCLPTSPPRVILYHLGNFSKLHLGFLWFITSILQFLCLSNIQIFCLTENDSFGYTSVTYKEPKEIYENGCYNFISSALDSLSSLIRAVQLFISPVLNPLLPFMLKIRACKGNQEMIQLCGSFTPCKG